MAGGRDLAFEDWVQDARQVDIVQAAVARGARLKGRREKVGPCPVCGGDPRKADRFAINAIKKIFNCRQCGKGGDVINLVMHIDGVDFLGACERLTGRTPPRGDSTVDPEALARRAEERRLNAAAQERKSAVFREAERRRLFHLWRQGQPVAGSPVESYLALRKVALPAGAAVRCLAAAQLFSSGARDAKVIHTGPAMMAAVIGPDDRFAGLHLTWIDLTDPDGKARVADPETGEVEAAKKMRGSIMGGRIELVRCAEPQRLVIGEGIEEELTVYRALQRAGWDLTRTAFWTALSLGNLGGPHRGTLEHPTKIHVDRLGRERPATIPSDVPDLAEPAIPVPDSVTELVLLGDGDSDRFLTETTLRRAARRYARRGRTIRCVWSPEGSDWNSIVRGEAA